MWCVRQFRNSRIYLTRSFRATVATLPLLEGNGRLRSFVCLAGINAGRTEHRNIVVGSLGVFFLLCRITREFQVREANVLNDDLVGSNRCWGFETMARVRRIGKGL